MASARRPVAFVTACSQSVTATYKPPPVKHVWVIDLENESFG